MNTRFLLFGCTVLFSGIAAGLAPVFAAPPPAVPSSAAPLPVAPLPAADTPAVAVVREFLADRAAGKYGDAYGLLSAEAQTLVPQAAFAAGDPPPQKEVARLPASILGIGALLADTHNTLGYTFTVVGPDSAVPGAVLVRVAPVGTVVSLLTVTDPATHTPRIDLMGSFEHASPKEFAHARANAQRSSSLSNLKQLSLGILQYNQDNDERMPDAAKWVDEIWPYVKSQAVFHDPSAPADEPFNYAYNRALSRKTLAQFDAPAQTVMLFESTKGVKNASDTGQSVPVPGRHQGGTDYAFADGHVKWVPDGTKLSYQLNGK